MELVIPAFAIGAMYLINNQTKKNSNESFKNRSQLPNVDVPNRNYPDEYPIVSSDTDQTSQLSTTNRYENAGGAYTDKYFNPNLENSLTTHKTLPSIDGSSSGPQYYSLTGDKVDGAYFEHNNMVPYFGSHLRNQHASSNIHEGVLDNYSGAGSQYIVKKEQSPMFAPIDNAQWAYGAPNQTDFIKSRINPSMKMSNVKPFAEETVAPGLGLGYTTEGAGGFNSGMMMREAWLDRGVDELRVANKPKASAFNLLGHEGPSTSYIKTNATIDQMGVFEKHLPDQSFALDQRDMNGPSSFGSGRDTGRLFTTMGAATAPTMRAVPIERFTSRPETSTEYSGGAGYTNSETYVQGEYMESHNQQLGQLQFAVANAGGRNYATDSDYEIKAKKAYPNNRSSNKQDSYFGQVGGGLLAAISPLLDVLRPSRRENTIGNLRPYNNAGTTVPNSYIFNPADSLPTTIKETTENSKFHLNVNRNQAGNAYQITEQQPIHTNRQDTSDFLYGGIASAGAGTRQMTSYESNYNQHTNNTKSSIIQGYTPSGNMDLMNSDINMRQSSRDNYLVNNRPISGNMPYQSANIENMGRVAGNQNSLYSGIQNDRNNLNIQSILKSNPYVLNHVNAL